MKYYVIEFSEGDSKIAGPSIGTYETLREAAASFHKRLGTAMSSDLYVDDLVEVIDSDGNIIKLEKYHKEEVTE